MSGSLAHAAGFTVVVGALLVLFAAGVRLPPSRAGWPRRATRVLVLAAAAAAVGAANVALYRHDLHLDVTRVQAFTPSVEARRVVAALAADVRLTYFYQPQDPAGRAAKTMVEILGRGSPRLSVRAVDPDRNPGLASRLGVRTYNVAVLESGGRRLAVQSTEDRDIALGILRVTRAAVKRVCFADGHGEYDVDNLEYHTHFEGARGHSHGAEGAGVVLMTAHGAGRLRRALEALGFAAGKVTLATAGRVPPECAALVDVNPRTPYTPDEAGALRAYLGAGGSVLLFLDLDFAVGRELGALLGEAGVRVGEGVVVDPLDHYFTDEQMVAVARYGPHAITRDLALSFYPGVRPLEVGGAPGVETTVLFSSSAQSVVRPLGPAPAAPPTARGARVLAAAAEGRLRGAAAPFRLVVVGDADFASNSFFPYMANSDVVLAMLAWLAREERAPTMRPPVEVLPRVVLTERQVRGIFVSTAVVMPALVAGAGVFVWWRRRC